MAYPQLIPLSQVMTIALPLLFLLFTKHAISLEYGKSETGLKLPPAFKISRLEHGVLRSGLETSQDSETSRSESETSRFETETSRSDSEISRSDTEISRSDSEISRSDSEISRFDAETSRSESETSRSESETSRFETETSRSWPETSRSGPEISLLPESPSSSAAKPSLDVELSPRELDRYYYYPVCDYNGHKFPAGTVYSPAPCVQCHCNATSGHVSCRVPPCGEEGEGVSKEDQGCIAYEHPEGSCCPKCVKRGCLHEGVAIPAGDNVNVSPCKRCYCHPDETQGVGTYTPQLTCLDMSCPPARCVDAVTSPGECCAQCPNGPNCWLDEKVIREGERIYIDKCRFCYCSSMEYIYNATRRHATCVRSFFCL